MKFPEWFDRNGRRDRGLYARPQTDKEAPFEVLLNWSTQKQILAQELSKRISGLENTTELTVLDVGSSKGTLIGMLAGQLAARGFERRIAFSLVEPDPSSVQMLRSYAESIQDHSAGKFTSRIFQTGWEEFTPGETYDAIIFAHVIYHFDPRRFEELFSKAIHALKPRGHMYISAREAEGNQVFQFIQKYRKLASPKESFNEITIDDVMPALEHIIAGNPSLRMEQKSLLGAVILPFASQPDEAKTIVSFILQRASWNALPTQIQGNILDDFGGKDGYLNQIDRFIDIFQAPPAD